jgi:glycosyltransferase involved in cell wall biosynthesis
LQEGLGLSILEAMAMGVPVVASDVGGIYTLIKHKHNGLLVPPKDEPALAEAIITLLKDDSLAREMGRSSRLMVEGTFTLDIMTDQVLAVYKEAINQKL